MAIITDDDLYIVRHTQYQHIKSDARAAETLAAQYGLKVDSVRGRLSRADTITNRLTVTRLLATTVRDTPPSVERQLAIIHRSTEDFNRTQAALIEAGQEVAAIFMSDVHSPYMRWDSLDLSMQIIEHVQPVYVSGQNDFNDNNGYGRWRESRPIVQQLWTSDLSYMRKTELSYYRMVHKSMPNSGQIVGVAGNHDNWWYAHLRQNNPNTAEEQIADYLEWLYSEAGVLVFANGKENAVRLSSALVWWHGQFVSKNPITNAKNTIEQFVEDGVASTVVVGHTHRPIHIPGATAGYPGVDFFNAPCLSRINQVPYLKRDPRNWGLGLVVCYYTPGTRKVRCELVVFQEDGKNLVAHMGEKRFTTRLDKKVSEM